MTGDAPSDEALARAARAGDEPAFEELLHRHVARLHEFLRPFARAPIGTDDLAQEVWVTVFRRLDRFDPARPFRPWLFTIARRAAIDAWRRRAPDAVELGASDWVDHRHPGAALAAAGEAASVWTWVASQVSADARDALWLMYREELTVREIAQVMNCTGIRIKVLLHRARRKLAASWAGGCGPEGAEAWGRAALLNGRSTS